MADGISFDFSDLNALAAHIDSAPGKMAKNVVTAVKVTAHHVKDDWRAPLSGSETVPGGAASISYDIKGSASALLGKSVVEAEIGPELKGQGPIVGILEYGTPNTGARGYGAEALHKNEGDFVKGIEKATEDIL